MDPKQCAIIAEHIEVGKIDKMAVGHTAVNIKIWIYRLAT